MLIFSVMDNGHGTVVCISLTLSDDNHLCTHWPATSSLCSNNDIVIGVVNGIKGLRMHEFKLGLAIQVLVLLIPEGSPAQYMEDSSQETGRVGS